MLQRFSLLLSIALLLNSSAWAKTRCEHVFGSVIRTVEFTVHALRGLEMMKLNKESATQLIFESRFNALPEINIPGTQWIALPHDKGNVIKFLFLLNREQELIKVLRVTKASPDAVRVFFSKSPLIGAPGLLYTTPSLVRSVHLLGAKTEASVWRAIANLSSFETDATTVETKDRVRRMNVILPFSRSFDLHVQYTILEDRKRVTGIQFVQQFAQTKGATKMN